MKILLRQRSVYISIIIIVFQAFFYTSSVKASESEWPEVTFETTDRILILAPHPDDEVIGCAGVIQKALSMHLPVRIVFLTYGDNNQWSFLVYRKHFVFFPGAVKQMGLIRHDEALAASKILGLSKNDLIFLGYPDFGTMLIWDAYWGKRPAFHSMLTRVSQVPYKDALRPGAPYKGEEIVKDLETILKDFKPTKIFVSHAADHNGDHRSLYLFMRVALWNLEKKMIPQIYPYIIHYKHWPQFTGLHEEEILQPPMFLRDQIGWVSYRLTKEEVDRKLEALKAHKSQYRSSAKYLLSFVHSNELFGDFPVIKLNANVPNLNLSSNQNNETTEGVEELTDVERAAFIGVEWRFARLENNELVLSFELSRPLGKNVEASIYIFGYRPDVSFEYMPKLHVKLGVLNYAIYDQNKKLLKNTIKIKRRAKEITIRLPLKVIGDPTRILTSARTYLGTVPLDWVSWRVLELSAN